MTTRTLALADALGNLVRFALLPGRRLDAVGVAAPIAGVGFETPIADRVFDSSAIFAALEGRCARAVISQHPRRAKPPIVDAGRDRWRRLIENLFCELEAFKHVAMRVDKTGQRLAAMINLAATLVASR